MKAQGNQGALGVVASGGSSPDYEDYTDTEEYQRFVGGLADQCRCDGPVCAGLLAGGFCDEIGAEENGKS